MSSSLIMEGWMCVCVFKTERTEIVCVWCFACSQAFHSVREPFYWQSTNLPLAQYLMSWTNEAQRGIYGVSVSAVPPERPDFRPDTHITASYPLFLPFSAFLFLCNNISEIPHYRKMKVFVWNPSLLMLILIHFMVYYEL